MTPPRTALNPVAWAVSKPVSKLTMPRVVEMTDKMMNPANENATPSPRVSTLSCFNPRYDSDELTPKPRVVSRLRQ